MSELRRTPLYEEHLSLGAKMVPFAGWEMPVQFTGVIAEHQAVRTHCGIFDVSHMGEVFFEGAEAEAALQHLTCNDLSRLGDGQAQYSAILNPAGGVVDDVIIYRLNSEHFLVCVNASNAERDYAWFCDHNRHDVEIRNDSSKFGQIAVQGPRAAEITNQLLFLSGLTKPGAIGAQELSDLKPFEFLAREYEGAVIYIARTGYTGEDGFEIFCPTELTTPLWKTFVESSHGVIPAGLGARDSLRLEVCYPLHGHELSEDISALESGLGWIVKFEKKCDFIGREALEKEKEGGIKRKLVGFEVLDNGIAREGSEIFVDGSEQVGFVTSGTKTPTVGKAIGMALVDRQYTELDTELTIQVRSRGLKARIVKKPFYKRSKGNNG